MFHQQWQDLVHNALEEIKLKYPNCSLAEKTKWRQRFLQIKQSCDQLLETWALVEEEIRQLLHDHPDLGSDETEIDEEIWLDESAVRQFRQGQGYYGLTMYAKAKRLFQEVIELEPDFLLGRLYLGLTHFQEENLDEARRQFELVAKTAAHETFIGFARHMLGCILVKEGNDRQAIREFSKVVSMLPDHADAWFNLGACHYRLEEYHEAIPYFYHALSLNEDDWESMYYLSSCYRHHQEWGSVSFWRLASYEKAKLPRIMESIAHDYEEMGQPAQAMEWYKRLLSSDPKKPEAYYGIAWNLWTLKRESESLLWLKKGLSLFPDHPDLLFAYVWISISQGELKQARSAVSRLPAKVAEQPKWLAVRSHLSTHTGDFRQAASIADQLITHEQTALQAMGYYQKGRATLEMGHSGEAISHFKTAQKLAPNWKDPLFYEGVCHLMEGRPDLTRSCWGQLISKS
ncbi:MULTISPECIES: lipopolysaccharide assembly protein LapB [Thermoactinomyces]|jgi:tetratricopeptide (TPR) repeat protein|uniref:Tetratricopeptide repeat protein n=1 Tax=Thermoactinomyces daqus TaxID=1329516 RepID=A0A7W2AIE7_9BACL|nr:MULTISPECIES: tetratricopeptide repeat protein [Thermoactinomyces]MBA4543180.1 tetratricopeptide repeat protein [Thermoactinomyces daqus]MBH8596583.1 tetratricopeptide repeat protein [Thermoactinomyces sp. CICC 10523]MBH8603345.1 tetratricopeptide repeat protein [Thermoactinomyces sp. CICC 10522]MBH8607888.1 tetratricopeptide repeat protein [Thermoactinomyces sp. CICC 10521]